ncbi:MAG: hypothetical protein ACOC56_04895 [Atribacterota bacterium]
MRDYKLKEIDLDAKLCYLETHGVVYFTTMEYVGDQWGDDWNDVPYQYNAGLPYTPCWHNDYDQRDKDRAGVSAGELCRDTCCIYDWDEEGNPLWKIYVLHFSGISYVTPEERSEKYSVEYINQGEIPWIEFGDNKLYAGTTIKEFIHKFRECGGSVFLEIE